MVPNPTNLTVTLLSICGIFCVAAVDYLTGIEVRVFPLYFLPLMFAARHLNKPAMLLLALLATVAWISCMYFGGREYSYSFIWGINFVTQGSAFVLVALLFSHVNAALRREHAYSRTDGLTGLYNSRSFYEQAASLLRLCHRKERPVTLVYIDLDNFKTANDTRGHQFGDTVLCKVAELFRENLRASDLVARMGGDEFAVVLPETGADAARHALEHLRTRLAEAPELASCGVTASIGAVSYPIAPQELEPMIKAADTLMYRVKKGGKNHVMVETV